MAERSHSILIVAGESSGDAHGAGLVEALKSRSSHPSLHWFGSGGPEMARAGVELLADVTRLAAIGPRDALSHAGDYWHLYRRLLAEVSCRRPRLAVLIDFPDFNLRLARRLRKMGVRVCYFVAPQLWAWRPSRVKQVRRFIDLMLVIFPFEVEFFARHGVRAHYVGNPSLSRLLRTQAPPSAGAASPIPVVGLLPGSRNREVERILPIQLDAAARIIREETARFWIVRAPSVRREKLEGIYQFWRSKGNPDLPLEIREEGSTRLMRLLDCAIIKSGTSTLESMVMQVPFAMVYRMSFLSWSFGRALVNTDTYCLANIIAGKRIVPEFVQNRATGEAIGSFIAGLLRSPDERKRIRSDLKEATEKLGVHDAYAEAAQLVEQQLEG